MTFWGLSSVSNIFESLEVGALWYDEAFPANSKSIYGAAANSQDLPDMHHTDWYATCDGASDQR